MKDAYQNYLENRDNDATAKAQEKTILPT